MSTTAPNCARTFSLLTAAALALQSAGGLFIPGLYRDNAWVSSVLRGQDFVALVLVVPLLIGSHVRAQQGSSRWWLIWLGVLYKVLYNEGYYLFGAAFNRFFLVYVAVFIFSAFAVVAALIDTDAVGMGATPIPPSRRKAAAAILFAEAGILAVMWVGQSLAYVATGTLPKLIADTGGTGTHLIAALDLTAVVAPVVLGSIWLWKSRPWGTIISAGMLVQGALIVVDLVVTPYFQAAAGVPDAWTMAPLFAAMGVGSVIGAVLLLRTGPVQPVLE